MTFVWRGLAPAVAAGWAAGGGVGVGVPVGGAGGCHLSVSLSMVLPVSGVCECHLVVCAWVWGVPVGGGVGVDWVSTHCCDRS